MTKNNSWIFEFDESDPPPAYEIKQFGNREELLKFFNKEEKIRLETVEQADLCVETNLKELMLEVTDLSGSYPDLLCIINFYFLGYAFDASHLGFLPSDLELLQAIVLSLDWSDRQPLSDRVRTLSAGDETRFDSRCIDPTNIIRKAENLRHTWLASSETRLRSQYAIEHIGNSHEAFLKYKARLQTLQIRNWASGPRMKNLVARLFSPYDAIFESVIGLTASELCDLFIKVAELVFDRIEEHNRVRKQLNNSLNGAAAFEIYAENFSDPDISRLSEFVDANDKDAKTVLIMDSDIFIRKAYQVTVEDIAKLNSKLDVASAERLLLSFSLEPGCLDALSRKDFFLNNPIWQKPFIHCENSFVLPTPHVLTAFLLPIVEGILLDTKKVPQDKYEKDRADFLELEAFKTIRQSFPQAEVWKNVVWGDDEKQGEVDILLCQGEMLLVVEAKGARVSSSARRGGDSLIQQTSKHLEKAKDQISNFDDFLQRHNYQVRLKEKKGADANVHYTSKPVVLQVSLVLEPFYSDVTESIGGLTARESAYSMSLTDLELILEILRNSTERFYYLYSRQLIRTKCNFIGDEMDLLGTYLSIGFVWDSFEGNLLEMAGSCRLIADPMMQDFDESHGKVKERYMSKWWLDVLNQFSMSHDCRLMDSIALWDLPYLEQKRLEYVRSTAANQVSKPNGGDPTAFLFKTRLLEEPALILGLVFKNFRKKNRSMKLYFEESVENLMRANQVSYMVCLAFDLREPEYPFSAMSFHTNI